MKMPEENPTPQGGVVDAQDAVKSPATFLLVVGIIGIVVGALSAVLNLVGAGAGAAASGGEQAMFHMMSGTIGVVFGIIGAIGSVVVTLGALKMKKMESYGLSMAAAIIAMLPVVSGCCLLGLPAGIWSLVVLMKPEVKDAFK
jgi:hypothetical protein